MAYKKGKSKHTGKVFHDDMHSHLYGMGSKDPLAHSSHHEANSEHGMPHGLHPGGGYEDNDEHDEDGKAMDENCTYHE